MCARSRPDGGTRPWDGKSPLSIAAAIIYVVSCIKQMNPNADGPVPTIAEIAQVAAVAEGTIRGTYRTLYADLPSLVPSWYVATADLKGLPQPAGGG